MASDIAMGWRSVESTRPGTIDAGFDSDLGG